MLIALELAGFKSFADKTRFDFADGITVVVGPNGSGKSNIVDAIKWVLGTQSAKSLRGEDMADVIFKGSAAGGRKPCNSAEATLILDNRKKILAVDAPEVHITRRVFRSGDSEYLINRQPCRLKDIKDLFRGTGVGIDAYSLIEQGKVDRMLQASAKDRRVIFEEAAGISRFKTRKIETERRLQRVDQNLIRLRDIVDEVHTRLTALKNQAAKAQQYREMTHRLAELRWQIGVDELLTHRAKADSLAASLAKNEESQQDLTAQLAAANEALQEIETRLDEHQRQSNQAQLEHQGWRERLAGLESSRTALSERLVELDDERRLIAARQTALAEKAEWTADEVNQRQAEVAQLQSDRQVQAERLAGREAELKAADESLAEQHARIEQIREQIQQHERQGHQTASMANAERTRVEHLEQQLATQQQQLEQLSTSIAGFERLLNEHREQREVLEAQAQEAQDRWTHALSEIETLRLELTQRQETAVHHQGKLQGARERRLLLEQLEEQQEGIGRGAKRLLDLAATENQAPWSTIKGLVADLIEIDVHLAPLIDVALGSAAETVVLEDGQIIDLLKDGSLNLGGRVSMIRMDRLPSRRSGEKIQLDGLRGVLGRADRLVHTQLPFVPLVQYLLGTTWLVDTLATALDLSHLRGAGLRFVTAECERIDADGTLSIGSLQTALGLVSRRSELLATRDEIRHLEAMGIEEAAEISRLNSAVVERQQEIKDLDEAARLADQAVSEAQFRAQEDARRMTELQGEQTSLVASIDQTKEQLSLALLTVTNAEVAAQAAIAAAQSSHYELVQQQDQTRRHEESVRQLRDSITTEKIGLARIEQRLESVRTVLEQLNRDADERQRTIVETLAAMEAHTLKVAQTQQSIVDAEQQTIELTKQIEEGRSQLESLQQTAASLHDAKLQSTRHRDQVQRQSDRAVEQRRTLETETELLAARIGELQQRYRDDYQLDLSDHELVAATAPLSDRQVAETEVTQLKQEIASVGSVNMEALRELDELQSRYDTLHGHYCDLTDAKQNLQRIIDRIDVDSQRLFTETLEAIRQNFQELYRRSFGGGHADLILVPGEDMSEAGVEIVATPPGKTALSNSLLSGGEKALTAVALIMSIFKFRPSPFCILDEVDAPFDEANIGRFVSVLTDFLHMTKFVVVSHSKKTMTAANTIYGITMQENGVSRQVAVRFENVDQEQDFLADDSPSNKAA